MERKTHRNHVMLILAILLLFVPVAHTFANAQCSAEIVTLERILCIPDNGENFFFKYPQAPVVNKHGTILVEDKNQLLLFSPDGSFTKNLFKKGQGPAELNSIQGFYFDGDNIIVCNRYPNKMLRFDRFGNFQRAIRFDDKLSYTNFLTYYHNRFYFLIELHGSTKNKAVMKDVEVRLVSASVDGTSPRYENIRFPKKYFVRNTNWMMNVHYVQIASINNSTLLIANNGDYDIKRLDLKKMSLEPFLKKKYKKVRYTNEWRKIQKPVRFPHEGISGKELKTFEREYLDDVQRIFVNKKRIWVLTSTFDEVNRLVNVDVYDLAGNPKGNLLLKIPDGIHLFKMSYAAVSLFSGNLYTAIDTKEGDKEIQVFKLLNIPQWAK